MFWTPLKAEFLNGHFGIFRLLLNDGLSVDISGTNGRIPLRAAACNGHLEVNRQLLSNGCSVHIARIVIGQHYW
jgi:ankyrin repeat protein